METADNCRRAAREAVADVEPPQLHALVDAILDEASMVPGVLTVKSAALVAAEAQLSGTGDGTVSCDPDPDPDPRAGDPDDAAVETDGTLGDAVSNPDPNRDRDLDLDLDSSLDADRATDALVTHAAGVQLIYEGLRLTRTLAHDEPWLEADPRGDDTAGAAVDIDGDLEILAADILVARGFYLLARTDAAGTAVRTVQSFGRDQTRRTELATTAATDRDDPNAATTPADPAAIDANLEHDILELAVQTGAAAVGDSPSGRVLALAADLADTVGRSFPPAAECLTELERSLTEPTDGRELEERPTDRATSATDP